MKTIWFALVLVLVSLGTVGAQKKDRSATSLPQADTGGCMPRPVSVDVADLQKLLEQKNLYVHKYDLSGLRDTTLRVVCQIDEYIGRDSVKTLRRAVLGNVYSAWDSTYVTTLSLHFVPLSDSTASLHCGMKERGQVGTFLRFRKAETVHTLWPETGRNGAGDAFRCLLVRRGSLKSLWCSGEPLLHGT